MNPAVLLPPPIAAYFAADTMDADSVAQCFTDDAVVVDEQRQHRGRPAITRWKSQVTAKYHYTSEPITVEVSGATAIVRARLTGDFPGSPVELQYRFTVARGMIARLEITR
jgi:ketosteroid isomerase-like protein